MPVSLINLSEIPKQPRPDIRSAVEDLPEWVEAKALIDQGIPVGKAVSITLTYAKMAKYEVDKPRTMPRFLTKYVKDIGRDYNVRTKNLPDEHSRAWFVRHLPAKKKRA